MRRPPTPQSPATRRIGDATRFGVSIDYLMAALLAAGAGAVVVAFDVPLKLDFASRDFNPFVLLALFLGAFALKFLYSAVRGTLLGRRFGESTLETEADFVRLGGTLKGRIRTSVPLAPTGEGTLTLRCIEQVVHTGLSSPTQTRTEDAIRWEAMRKLPVSAVLAGDGIAFEFAIPEKALAMPDARAKGEVRWTLEVAVPQKGIDYYALFGVDVRPKGG